MIDFDHPDVAVLRRVTGVKFYEPILPNVYFSYPGIFIHTADGPDLGKYYHAVKFLLLKGLIGQRARPGPWCQPMVELDLQ